MTFQYTGLWKHALMCVIFGMWVPAGCSDDAQEGLGDAGDGEDLIWATVIEEPVVELGVDPVDAAHAFDGIVGVVPVGGDRIAVADKSQEVRVFDLQGRLVAASAGRGEGPGELQGIYSLSSYSGDSLVVWDLSMRRFTVFDDRAATGRVVRVDAGPGMPLLLVVEDAFADGSLLAMAGPPEDRDFDQERWGAIALVHVTADGETVSLIGDVPLQPCRPGQDNCARGYRAFRSTWTAGNARVYFARPDRHEIQVMNLSGELVSRLTPPPGVVQTDVRQNEEPSYTRLVVDREENLWAALGGENGVWLVFSPTGEYRGKVQAPTGLSLVEIGDGVMVGVQRDEFDVERVAVFEVR